MYLEVYFHVLLNKCTGNIRIDLLIFLFLVTLAVDKTLLEFRSCYFKLLINYILSFTFIFYFIQNFENKIYMFRYLKNPSANTMKPLQRKIIDNYLK